MACRYLAADKANVLEQPLTVITVTNEDANLPKANLKDRKPGTVHLFASDGTPRDYTVDLGELLPNGGFEAAFTGGLPTSVWGKTAGATLVRRTSDMQSGAACLEVQGGSANYGYYDFVVFPGQRFRLSVASRIGTGGTTDGARVFLRNLYTGRCLNNVNEWSVANIFFHRVMGTSYATTTFDVVVEEPAGGPSTMTLRLEFYGDDTSPPFYDDCSFLWAVNGCAVIGHNHVGHGATADQPQLRSSTDNFGSSDTLEKRLDAVRPAYYGLLSTTVYRRYLRLRLNPARAAGTAPWTGELVMGYFESLGRSPDYGWRAGAAFPQIRPLLPNGLPAGVYELGQFEQRRFHLPFTPGNEAEFRELRDVLYRASRGGAIPMVLIPWDTEDTVAYGRLDFALAYDRPLMTQWNTALEFVESGLPLVTAA